MTDWKRKKRWLSMNKGYRSRRFSLSTGADVRNSSYVWYEDMMRDRYSVKTHLEECA